jgi:hypothetical protein
MDQSPSEANSLTQLEKKSCAFMKANAGLPELAETSPWPHILFP